MAVHYAVLSLLSALFVGGLTAGVCARLRFVRTERVFRCRMRTWVDRPWSVPPRWSRRTHAFWTHDVLVIRRGLVRPRILAFRVRPPHDAVQHATAYEVTGLGAQPHLLGLHLHDGTRLDVVASATDGTVLAGPFLAAAIPALPPAPPEPRRRYGWPPPQ
jgi:hypothetical protein